MTLRAVRAAAARCRDCPLWANATQTVFGEVLAIARLLADEAACLTLDTDERRVRIASRPDGRPRDLRGPLPRDLAGDVDRILGDREKRPRVGRRRSAMGAAAHARQRAHPAARRDADLRAAGVPARLHEG